ncbi:hypothetical protein ERJ75_001165700 [Trypanosoma vivax]|nr:hypothetical protein ERJ75_001165700 [Trypanosoma vivax]
MRRRHESDGDSVCACAQAASGRHERVTMRGRQSIYSALNAVPVVSQRARQKANSAKQEKGGARGTAGNAHEDENG